MFLVFLMGIILFKFAVFSFKNDDDTGFYHDNDNIHMYTETITKQL